MDDYSPVKPTISVVVPVFNEEENIAAFHRELTRTIDTIVEYDWEVIFVDDGSRDDTVAEVLALREHDCRVKCVQLSRNFGSHAALLAGLSNCSGAAAVMMSVDLQDPPELIREFLVEWKKRNHIVWGVRKTRDDPWSKKVLANLFYVVCRRILPGFPAGGMDCGLFDRQVIRELLSINERHGYVFATLFWSGFRQAQIPYARQARTRGVSKWPLRKRIKAALDLIVSFSYFPVRIASYLGILVSLFSLAFGIFLVVYHTFFGGVATPGWASLMVTMLLLGGIQLTVLGVLGEYIWRTNDQVRGRPQFIVMETHGIDSRKAEHAVTAADQDHCAQV